MNPIILSPQIFSLIIIIPIILIIPDLYKIYIRSRPVKLSPPPEEGDQEKIKKAIDLIILSNPKSPEEFSKRLYQSGYQVYFNIKNDNNNIVGISFSIIGQPGRIKGSDIGRSWYYIKDSLKL